MVYCEYGSWPTLNKDQTTCAQAKDQFAKPPSERQETLNHIIQGHEIACGEKPEDPSAFVGYVDTQANVGPLEELLGKPIFGNDKKEWECLASGLDEEPTLVGRMHRMHWNLLQHCRRLLLG
jgi:hypothetical protein